MNTTVVHGKLLQFIVYSAQILRSTILNSDWSTFINPLNFSLSSSAAISGGQSWSLRTIQGACFKRTVASYWSTNDGKTKRYDLKLIQVIEGL